MTIRTPTQALAAADATHTNAEGYCQQVTRGYYLAPSAGDRDGDGDADAYDGWLSEPAWARHVGDRNPPAGYPVSFKGGSRGHGHRAISRGNGTIRSTDFDSTTKRYRAGVLGNGTIAEVEAAMGVTYLGWSKTIDGQSIPPDPTVQEKPVSTPRPSAHQHLVSVWNNDRAISLHDVSLVEHLNKAPYSDAAHTLHHELNAAVEKYFKATDTAMKSLP